MNIGRDVEGGFEMLDDHGDMIGAAYLDEQTGRVDVTPAKFYGERDPLPIPNQEMQAFAEEEFRRRKLPFSEATLKRQKAPPPSRAAGQIVEA